MMLKDVVWVLIWPISELFMQRPEAAEKHVGLKYVGAVLLATVVVVAVAVVLGDVFHFF